MATCCANTILTLPTGDGVLASGGYDANTEILTLTTSLGTNILVSIPTGGAISILTDNGDGTFTHNDGEGTIVNFNALSTLVNNADNTYTHTDEAGTVTGIINNISTYNDETGGDSPAVPVAPANPPANNNAGDTLIEQYDDNLLLWSYDGANWVLESTITLCCPDTVVSIGAPGNFLDPDNPLTTEVDTFITNSGPYSPGTIFMYIGNGTADDPDYAWYYDGTETTRIEVPNIAANPFRIIGADSGLDDGQAAQPRRLSDVLVADNIQHTGDVFFGGAVGDVMDTVGNLPKVQIDDTLMLEQTSNIDAMQFLHNGSNAGHLYYRLANRAETGAGSVGYLRVFPTDDTKATTASGLLLTDRQGNVGLYSGASPAAVGTTFRVFIFEHFPGVPSLEVVAPAAPWSFSVTHHYTITAGTAEHFIMDGAGNVTQLSSHPDVAMDLIPPPKWISNPVYTWSYNVFTRVLTGSLNAGSNSKTLQADIDDGSYDVYDDNGKIIDSGIDERLVYNKYHADDPIIDNYNTGKERWNAWEERIIINNKLEQEEWDKYAQKFDKVKAEKDLGSRKNNLKKKDIPPGLSKSVGWNKKKK